MGVPKSDEDESIIELENENQLPLDDGWLEWLDEDEDESVNQIVFEKGSDSRSCLLHADPEEEERSDPREDAPLFEEDLHPASPEFYSFLRELYEAAEDPESGVVVIDLACSALSEASYAEA